MMARSGLNNIQGREAALFPDGSARSAYRAGVSSLARVALVSLTCGWLLSCGEPPTGAEEAIRLWVQQGHAAAEQKDRSALVDMISPAYADARGNSRDDIENMLRVYFLRQHSVSLLARVEELRVIGDTAAEVEVAVGMAGTNDGALGFSADAYRVAMELVRDGDDWLLIAARWGDIGGELR